MGLLRGSGSDVPGQILDTEALADFIRGNAKCTLRREQLPEILGAGDVKKIDDSKERSSGQALETKEGVCFLGENALYILDSSVTATLKASGVTFMNVGMNALAPVIQALISHGIQQQRDKTKSDVAGQL